MGVRKIELCYKKYGIIVLVKYAKSYVYIIHIQITIFNASLSSLSCRSCQGSNFPVSYYLSVLIVWQIICTLSCFHVNLQIIYKCNPTRHIKLSSLIACSIYTHQLTPIFPCCLRSQGNKPSIINKENKGRFVSVHKYCTKTLFVIRNRT